MSVFTEYGIKAQIPEAHDLLFTDNIGIQGNTIGGGGTPETPIALQSVTSPINVAGKNLFNIEGQINSTPDAEKYNNGLKVTKPLPYGGNSDRIPMSVPAGSYRLSYDIIEQTAKNILRRVFYIDNSIYNIPATGVCNFTNEVKYIQFYVGTTSNDEVGKGYTIDNIQVERGTTKTEYEPYQGTTISIPIKDTNSNALTLRRAGTAYDSIYKGNSKWYLRKSINEQVLNGSEDWYIASGRFYTNIYDAKTTDNSTILGNIIATGYQTGITLYQLMVSGDKGVYCTLGEVGIHDPELSEVLTVAEFKTWLSTHNITIAYELITPQIIELHEDTATALDNLAALNPINRFVINYPAAVIDLSKGLSVSYGTSKRANFKIPSIHNGKTVTRIEVGGFSGNNQLTYLYIPESIEELGDRALNQNINITDVYINRSSSLGITTSGTNMFENCPKLTNIYVPADSITAYKTATNWIQYADKIRAL